MIQMSWVIADGPFSLHHTGKVADFLKKRDQWLGGEVLKNTRSLIISVVETNNGLFKASLSICIYQVPNSCRNENLKSS